MEETGLMPSDTGEVGGKETGQQMKEYVAVGGKFEKAYERIAGKYEIPFQSFNEMEKKGRGEGEREKYVCVGCGWSVWSKAGLKAVCGECGEIFESAGGNTTAEVKDSVYEVMKVKYGG